jgi:arylsulfatase A-like enzyme
MQAVLALALSCGSGCGGSGRPQHAQNAVLIVADTLRADRLGCYGHPRPTSPRIDALAAEGVLYESCHSQACWTLPSMISLMSGVPVTRQETAVPRLPFLAEVLRGHGLDTAAFLANPTLGVERGFDRGFTHFGQEFDQRAPGVARAFADWLAEREARRAAGEATSGFFAWVHFIDPHAPYEPLPEHDRFTGPRPDRERLLPRWRAAEPRVAELSPRLAPLAFETAVERMEAESNRYDGEVRSVDEGVGLVLDALARHGLHDETLVVVLSDHGEMLYEQAHYPYLLRLHLEQHGGLPEGIKDLFVAGHRPWYYEDLWRTPLILAGPGQPRGVRRGGLAANLDVFPTLLEALDLPAPRWLAGASLHGGRTPQREEVFAYGQLTTAVLDRAGRKLVVHTPKMFEPDASSAPVHLYDLAGDPGEERECAAQRPGDVRELAAAVRAWRERFDCELVDTDTPEAVRALRELGYLDGAYGF